MQRPLPLTLYWPAHTSLLSADKSPTREKQLQTTKPPDNSSTLKIIGVARGAGGAPPPLREKLYHTLEKNRGKLREKEKNQGKNEKIQRINRKT